MLPRDLAEPESSGHQSLECHGRPSRSFFGVQDWVTIFALALAWRRLKGLGEWLSDQLIWYLNKKSVNGTRRTVRKPTLVVDGLVGLLIFVPFLQCAQVLLSPGRHVWLTVGQLHGGIAPTYNPTELLDPFDGDLCQNSIGNQVNK